MAQRGGSKARKWRNPRLQDGSMFHNQGNQRYDDQFFKSDFQAPKKPTKKKCQVFSWLMKNCAFFAGGNRKKNQIDGEICRISLVFLCMVWVVVIKSRSVFQAKVKAAVAPKSVAQRNCLMHVLNGFGIYGCFQK